MSEEIPMSLINYIDCTTQIVSAYVQHNAVPAEELPALVDSIHASLKRLGVPEAAAPSPVDLKPAVPVDESVTDDFIISLEDGRKLKSMKRYLASLGMSPDQYRAKWGLPKDYPMVAPSYAAKRSEISRLLDVAGRMRATLRMRSQTANEMPA